MKKVKPKTERQKLGQLGETRALNRYLSEGWTLLERNWTCRWGEIDFIVTKGDWVVFVEVRTLSNPHAWTRPERSVGLSKQRRLSRTARTWIGMQELWIQDKIFRFDIVSVIWPRHQSNPKIEIFPHAFEWT